MLQQHWQELTLRKKTLRRLANHWALRSTHRSARGWHRILITLYQNDVGDEENSPKVDLSGCVCSVLQALPHPSALSCPQSAGAPNKSKIWPVSSKPRQVVSFSPKTAAFQELADILFPYLLPTWSPAFAMSTTRERNPLEWLNKCCWNYPQQEANIFCDLEKLKVIKGDDWE